MVWSVNRLVNSKEESWLPDYHQPQPQGPVHQGAGQAWVVQYQDQEGGAVQEQNTTVTAPFLDGIWSFQLPLLLQEEEKGLIMKARL